MRVLEQNGSRFIPAFNEQGQRMTDLDLYVALGAHFDPRHKHPGPRQITIAAPTRLPKIGESVDPGSFVEPSKWVFDFGSRDVDGVETLTVTMRAVGDATRFEDMPHDDHWGRLFFDLTREYARLCRD